ncbi:MAG: hypothetical protein KGH55_03210 [Nanoarchaeota archaeon]|nr:hypothetical protein [Nanoarchaeota archaeon]
MPESENKEEINFDFKKVKNFFSDKRVRWAITAIVLLVIIITATSIRLSNLPQLVDHTTGNYTLSDPDALYWLRLEQHLLQTGNLNGIDSMRYPSLNASYSHEMLVYVIVDAYKILSSFTHNVTIQLVDAVYPAYAFALMSIIFFFLVYVLTKSKSAAILATAFLAYSPAFLFRTITGVSGHEALGMVFLFSVFLSFVLALKNFHKSWKHTILWGILVGFLISCSFASWGGTINFIFLILPIALFIYYLFNVEKENLKEKQKFAAFYLTFVATSILGTLLVHLKPSDLYPSFMTTSGILIPAVLVFVIVDTLFDYVKGVKKSKFRLLISLAATIVVGILGLEILGKGGFSTISSIYQSLIHPLGVGRVGLTVAYFAQPYLTDFQAQTLLPFFWLFLLGMGIVCIEIVKGVKSAKHRIYLSVAGMAAIIGILFSRYSSSGVLNGVSFLSQAIYFLGFAILIACLIWIYRKDKHKLDDNLIFIFAWMFIMLITVRAAARTIFMVVPFMAFAGAYLVVRTASYTKKAKGHDRFYVVGALFLLSLVISFVYLFGNPITGNSGAYYQSSVQAAQTGPLMNDQWQNAMAWVRNNTAPGSVFSSWWDYGYLLQTAGDRPTVLDGGNSNTYWDHLMGRYVLTTPNPDTALAFWKAQNVSYFLMDFSDFGKYAAFSSIGSDASGIDRYSAPTIMAADSSKDYASSNNTMTRVFQGATFVDQDISYGGTFLPGPSSQGGQVSGYNSYVIGVTIQYARINNGTSIILSQPSAVFQYNSQQYILPMRYTYYNGQIIDYGSGINATFMIIPSINTQSNGQISIDPIGAGIYLSPKVQQSLYARLYLMGDPYNQYPTLSVGDIEENDIVSQLNARGANIKEFAYYQGQLLAPLEIWKVNYPSSILNLPQFRQPSGEYAGLDNLTLTS